MNSYEVSISDFHGPMDLLLHLIKRDEIDVFNIPMIEITNEFLSYIEQAEELNLELASEFLLMATKLMAIKAAMLLPKEDDLSEDDPRHDLVQSILEYELIHNMLDAMQNRLTNEQQFFAKLPEPLEREEEVIWEEVGIESLLQVFQNLDFSSEDMATSSPAPPMLHPFIPIQQCVKHLERELEKLSSLRFSQLLGFAPSKTMIISYFLAILELGHMRKIRLYLSTQEQDMVIQKR